MLSCACETFYLIDENTNECIGLFIKHRFNNAKHLTHGFSTLGKVLAEQGMGVYLHKLGLRESLSETNRNLLGQSATQSRLARPRLTPGQNGSVPAGEAVLWKLTRRKGYYDPSAILPYSEIADLPMRSMNLSNRYWMGSSKINLEC